jgi:hypothetical protein
MINDPVIKELVEQAEHMPSQGENWPAFIDTLRENDYDSKGPTFQGGPGSLTRYISVAIESYGLSLKASKLISLSPEH